MFLIVGLGNPGIKYRKTRHNAGFMVLEHFQKENNFPKFKTNKKAKAEITKGEIDEKVVFLAKPQTHMNNSGQAVKFLLKENGFDKNSLIIVHDDFDLPFGEVKIVENSGSGGHHGVESIIDALGTQNFTRIKIGIRPIYLLPTTHYPLMKAENFVLKKFTKEEEKQLPQILGQASQTLLSLL